MNASLKYPCLRKDAETPSDWLDRSRGAKWGIYDQEHALFTWTREGGPAGAERTLEAILVDWADDVSYATHDIEDYSTTGLVPLHQLGNNPKFLTYAAGKLQKKYGDGFDTAKLSDAVERLKDQPLKGEFRGSRIDRQKIQDFISDRIGLYSQVWDESSGTGALEILPGPPYVRINADLQYEVEALKQLTWYYVIDNPPLAVTQVGQEKIIEELYRILSNLLAASRGSPRIPIQLVENYEHNKKDEARRSGPGGVSENVVIARSVCDFVASMTEDQAVDLHSRFTGKSETNSMFGTWF
ncbi:hypothetical protein [Jidongwangia harbinensis]|uniref:hypothetical protein n=1 Tax=Jidongwangia harbinensis TaxID=2878561 RepID=UPI001CDA3C20|nr:hypothetical protein [Jidongwangia harbinensis]MCA2214873.1 hypothetical protein [Jidongwangia harbinensis]